jgi:hypothetical protein
MILDYNILGRPRSGNKMTEHTCKINCTCNEDTLKGLIHKWWQELKYSKKELLDDSLPSRFFCNFRIGHYRGEDRVHVEFNILREEEQIKLKIYMLYPEWSPLHPIDTFKDIVCWYISAFKERKIPAELKQGLLSRKIEC